MASPDDNLNTTPQAKENNAEVETNASTADQQAFIANSIKALQALVNQSRGRTSGMRPTELDFEEDDLSHPFTGSEYVEDKYKDVAPTHRTKEEDLSKPFKEAQLKSPFSSRILMFSAPKNKMPPTFESRGWFDKLPNGCIDKWFELKRRFLIHFSQRKRCFKDPTEIYKIQRKANILDVPEIMQIGAFMYGHKCPELSKKFAGKIPRTVDEMMERVDDFLRSEEAYDTTEAPRGEATDSQKKGGNVYKSDRSHGDKRKPYKSQNNYGGGHQSYSRDARPTYPREGRFPYQQHRPAQRMTINSLSKTPTEILTSEHQLNLLRPPPMIGVPRKENLDRFCEYHGEKGHYTDDCYQLKKQLETALESGKLNHLVREVKNRGKGSQKGKGKVINMVRSSGYGKKRMLEEDEERWMNAEIAGFLVQKIYVDNGADSKIMNEHCFRCLDPWTQSRLRPSHTKLVGFSGEVSRSLRKIELEVIVGEGTRSRRTTMEFEIVRAASPYNVLLGRPGISILKVVPLTVHAMFKFPTPGGVVTIITRPSMIIECQRTKKMCALDATSKTNEGVLIRCNTTELENGEVSAAQKPEQTTEEVKVNDKYLEQLVTINARLSPECKYELRKLLRENLDVLAWKPSDMTGIPRHIAEHSLNDNPSKEPVQMSREDEEKTAFYTDQGTYCYTKMPFGLKNVGATYQRLVDKVFKDQIRRNLEAYVDDMVIKSRDEKGLLTDIEETFKTLRKINMKLNPKKCSFGMEEGKFLGYIVTSEGIRANPGKTKAIMDMQSPKSLKQMQTFSGKLAALNRFLSKGAERSLPFFDTLKGCTKDNFKWTKEAEQAFLEMKKHIAKLPLLTTPKPGEEMFIYLSAAELAVSAVLVAKREGKQVPIHHVSRTLHDAEINYSPMEKLALSLLHASRRLKRYFQAHQIRVITDQPIRQVLNKTETSGRLALWAVELGAFEIEYKPRNSVKGQVLADFLVEMPTGSVQQGNSDMQKEPPSTTAVANTDMEISTEDDDWRTKRMHGHSSLMGPRERKEQGPAGCSPVQTKLKLKEINSVVEEEGDTWMTLIIKCLEKDEWPEDPNERRKLRLKLPQYVMEDGVLFKKSYLVPMLRCVGPLQANYVIREIHMGSCEMHSGPRSVVAKAIRQGYYWPTMHADARQEIRKFGPLPEAPGRVKFILVAIDYFTKWVEAKPLAKISGKDVKILFGIPKIIVTDNGTQFVNDPFKGWCEGLHIKQINTAVAHPQANGLVERANKSLMEGVKTRLGRAGSGWVDELPNVLWAHRTMLKQSNGETPFSLTYGSEAVIPAEISMPTHRTMMINEALNNDKLRLNLDLLPERKDMAAIKEAKYKKKMEQQYNKRVRPVSFRLGEYVYRRNEASRAENQGKLGPTWEGPYQILEAFQKGPYKLATMEGDEIPRVWHTINLGKCYI
ncbi:reverse transcriptase domain-containing protein [Tanacetum coccineum]